MSFNLNLDPVLYNSNDDTTPTDGERQRRMYILPGVDRLNIQAQMNLERSAEMQELDENMR
jgi:hypothetical protein